MGFPKIDVFGLFHVHVDHPDGTQVVPRICKSKNMMFKLSNALSDVIIRLLEPDSENVEILKFICGSKFSKIEIGRYRPGNHIQSLFLSSWDLKPYYMQ